MPTLPCSRDLRPFFPRSSGRRRSLLGGALALLLAAGASAGEIIYSTEGNRLRRYDVDSVGGGTLLEDVLVDRASAGGRDLNGQICLVPDGTGRIVMGEDSGQPHPPAGWGVLDRDGEQVGKLTPSFPSASPEPFGCAFDATGRLFTSDIGNQVSGACNGQLTLWFPPFDHFPGVPGAFPDTDATSPNGCKIAVDLCTAGGVAVDEQGRVIVAQTRPGGGGILRFTGPFPTSADAAGGCGATDSTGAPMADVVNRESFVDDLANVLTPSTLARTPDGGWYVSSVLTGIIAEYDANGSFVRRVLEPPPGETGFDLSVGHPQGISVAGDGTLYYADLQLVQNGSSIGPGPDGKVRRVRFDAAGAPLPNEIVRSGLSFPDGVSVLPGDLEPAEWRTHAGSEQRSFFHPDEVEVKASNADRLETKWSFATGAIVTASPAVARVDVPGEGLIPVVYVQSWDGFVYAIRHADGTELWRFAAALQPGASFPNTATAHVESVGGVETVFIGAGETMYALDAVTGAELWHFEAGTGCRVPGACGFSAERNEIESTAAVADGKVFFGMDVNDVEGGKGGFYALDAADGRLAWFFDLESGATCAPLPGEDIRRYDGYHDEAELGLPAGFHGRAGCDFDRTGTGCGNVWSSPAIDPERGLVIFASSNCDTDSDPLTLRPPPPMPPYDEAIVALNFDGTPAWHWRPREVDNADLAFGAVPNLFSIELDGRRVDVVGVGNKDGSYYLLDRDGENEQTGVRWDDTDPSALPYWVTNVVPGGAIGGVVATAAVDEASGRIYFGTAPGFDPGSPQRPTVHALDASTGTVLWQNSAETNADATFSPTSAVPGLVLTGAVVGGRLRTYDATSGERLATPSAGFALASGAAVVDGRIVVGAGIGTRTDDPTDASDITSRIPQPVTAFGLLDCGNGRLDGLEACDDRGVAGGDGCSATCGVEPGYACGGEPSTCVGEGVLSEAGRECLERLHKAADKLSLAQSGLTRSCVKGATAGAVASPAACSANVSGGKVGERIVQLQDHDTSLCVPDPPAWGYTGAAIVEDANVQAGRDLTTALFGLDLDAVVADRRVDKAGARCQVAVLSRSGGLFRALWREARRAGKNALRAAAPPSNAQGLAAVLSSTLLADTRGRLARRAARLDTAIQRRCAEAGPSLAALFAGTCDTSTPASLAACAETTTRCRFCESLRRTDRLPLDCDSFDDATLNETCS